MPFQTIYRDNFLGGMNRQKYQSPKEMYLIKNMRVKADGTLTLRRGQVNNITAGSGSAGNIEGLYGFYSSAFGTLVYSIKQEDGTNDKIYADSDEITGPNFGTGARCVSIEEYRGNVFFCNGETDINYHVPGTTTRAVITATTGTLPTGYLMKFYNNRMYVAGDDDKLYYSQANLFTTLPGTFWHANNNIAIGNQGDNITGLYPGKETLTIFKDESFHLMYGNPADTGGAGDYQIYNFPGIGCSAPRSIASFGSGLVFFANNQRLYFLDSSRLIDLDPDNKMSPYFNEIPYDYMQYVACKVFNDELWFYMPTEANGDKGRMLIYNTKLNNWVEFDNIHGYAMDTVKSENRLVVGDAASGKIYDQDVGDDDDGTGITFELIGRQENLRAIKYKNRYNNVLVYADMVDSESMTVSYELDDVAANFANGTITQTDIAAHLWGAENYGVSAWAGDKAPIRQVLRFTNGINVIGTYFRLKFTGTVSPTTSLLAYGIDAEESTHEGEKT